MDIDTTPASHHDNRPSMQLDIPPPDEIMMEVDPDISLGPAATAAPDPQNPSVPQNSVLPSNSLAHQWFQPSSPTKPFDYSPPPFHPLPNPPSAVVTTSDVVSWPKLKLDQLFIEWFSRPDSQTWIQNLFHDLSGPKPSTISFVDFPNRSSRYDRSHSPSRSKSPSSQGNATFSPQQAPSSPVSRLFRTHVPFDDSESSPHSPPATPLPGIAVPNLKPALSVQPAISMDLGKSGSASPLAVDQSSVVQTSSPQSDQWKIVSSDNSPTQPVPAQPDVTDASLIFASSQNLTGDTPSSSNTSNTATDRPNEPNMRPVNMDHLKGTTVTDQPNGNDTNTQGMSVSPNEQPSANPVGTKNLTDPAPATASSEQSADAENMHLKADSSESIEMTTDSKVTPNGGVSTVDGFQAAEDPKPVVSTPDNADANTDGEKQTPSVNSVNAALPPTKPRSAPMSDAASQKSLLKRKTLPRFYFPCGPDAEVREKKEREWLADYFKGLRAQNKPARVSSAELQNMMPQVTGLPSYYATIIFNIIQEQFPRNNDETMKDVDGGEEASSSSCVSGMERNPMAMSGEDAWRNNADTKMADGDNSGGEMKDVTGAPAEDKPSVDKLDEYISEDQLVAFYKACCAGKSREARLFNTLLGPAPRNYLVPSDFKPLMQALLMNHPGLAFLHATPEFQQRYSETVIERIYFGCTRQHNGRLTLSDIKRCKLLNTLMLIDQEDDINRERRYFSYEHFYVLYCRFWELDANHDLQIDKEDLTRYSSHSLTTRIVDRIFSGHARPLDAPQNTGYMSYTDFIWFCLSEEDKTSDTAIDYWFRCIDMDGDGMITMYDMEYFYKEQLHRMVSFGHEPVQVKDILCQLLDMISPNMNPPFIRRRDLKKCRLAGNFFNILFNLNKFFTIEARDPLQIRQEHATPDLTDWDRFAAIEYLRLSADEEGDEDEPWEEVGDAPNPLLSGEAPF